MEYQEIIDTLIKLVPNEKKRGGVLELITLNNTLSLLSGKEPIDKDKVVNSKIAEFYETFQRTDNSLETIEKSSIFFGEQQEALDPRIVQVVNPLTSRLQELLQDGFDNFGTIEVKIPTERFTTNQVSFFDSVRKVLPALAKIANEQLFDIFFTGKTSENINLELEKLGVDIDPEKYLTAWQLQLK